MIYHSRSMFRSEFKSISLDAFYEVLQEEASQGKLEAGIDLRVVIEGFVGQRANTIVTVNRLDGNVLRVIKKSIVLPFNFITSSMELSSDFKWLNKNYSSIEYVSIPSLQNADWIIVNVEQLGFYRVHYDDNNWKALINAIRNDSQIFSSRTKAQLIDDAMSLAIDGYLSTSIALDLLMELQNETHYLPWNAALRNLLQLSNLLSSSEVHQDFQVSSVYCAVVCQHFHAFVDFERLLNPFCTFLILINVSNETIL